MHRFHRQLILAVAALGFVCCDTPGGPSAPARFGYLWARALADKVAREWNPDAPCSEVTGVVAPDGRLTGEGLFTSYWELYYHGGGSYLRVTVDPAGGVSSEVLDASGPHGDELEVPGSLDSTELLENVKNNLSPPPNTELKLAEIGLLASTLTDPLWELEVGYDYQTPICGDWSGDDLPEAAVDFELTGLAYVDDFYITVDVAGEYETFVIERMVLRDTDSDGLADWFGATAWFWDYTLKLRVDGYLDPYTAHVDGTWSWEAFPFEDEGVWSADWERFRYYPTLELRVDPETGEVVE